MTTFVRMHLPGLGTQPVTQADVSLWEKRGGYVLPDPTPEEVAAAAARQKADDESTAIAEQAQKDADRIRLKEEEAVLAANAPVVVPVRPSRPVTPTEGSK